MRCVLHILYHSAREIHTYCELSAHPVSAIQISRYPEMIITGGHHREDGVEDVYHYEY